MNIDDKCKFSFGIGDLVKNTNYAASYTAIVLECPQSFLTFNKSGNSFTKIKPLDVDSECFNGPDDGFLWVPTCYLVKVS